jgi:hypothetical protein
MELKNVEILRIGELKTFKNSDFTCVDWVVKTNEEYPQTLQLQSNKEKAENVIKYQKVGDKVDVSINLRGREWTNPQGELKVFNTIEAWKVFKANDTETAIKQATEMIDKVFEPAGDLNTHDESDLPF